MCISFCLFDQALVSNLISLAAGTPLNSSHQSMGSPGSSPHAHTKPPAPAEAPHGGCKQSAGAFEISQRQHHSNYQFFWDMKHSPKQHTVQLLQLQAQHVSSNYGQLSTETLHVFRCFQYLTIDAPRYDKVENFPLIVLMLRWTSSSIFWYSSTSRLVEKPISPPGCLTQHHH